VMISATFMPFVRSGVGGAMASRLFSDDQLEALKGFPDIDKDELIRFSR
jgi:hypothetical protein